MTNIQIETKPFVVSKTSDVFFEVTFSYAKGKVWNGCIPQKYKEFSLDLTYEEVEANLGDWYRQLSYENRPSSIIKAMTQWGATPPDATETGRVFLALLDGKGEWVCRRCGTGKINDQPAARIRDIKKRGYIIATKTRTCSTCKARTYQDILVFISHNFTKREEFRQPIAENTKRKILSILGYRDVVFDTVPQRRELVIDHKFPSQRWNATESRNHPDMTDREIREKFQLLTNQTNMLKSRCCDACVKDGVRAKFMGISWYYKGSNKWEGEPLGNKDGCIGCPWYDVEMWRKKLVANLK